MKKNRISKYILIVSLLSLFVVLVLIIQGSYSNLLGQSTKIDADPGQPIDPVLNTSVIEEITTREILEVPSASPLPTESPTPFPL